METTKQRSSRLYYEANKQRISEKRKEWYILNRTRAITKVKEYQARKKALTPIQEQEQDPIIKVDGPIKVSF